jgi:ABC-type multidrug transport system ATPase subunit
MVITADSLTKSFGRTLAVSGISLEVGHGAV